MSIKKSIMCALLFALSFLSPANATVITFSSLSDSHSIFFSTTHDGASLLGSVDLTLTSWTATEAVFSVSVSNNSFGPGTNRLMSFGIEVVTPTLTGASGSGDWDADIDTTLPSLSKVDLCIFSSTGCPGGDIKDGLGEGESDVFTLTLTSLGDFTDGISFTSPYGVKFQDVGLSGESYEFTACTRTEECSHDVPEPATLILVGLGLLGAAATWRRQA